MGFTDHVSSVSYVQTTDLFTWYPYDKLSFDVFLKPVSFCTSPIFLFEVPLSIALSGSLPPTLLLVLSVDLSKSRRADRRHVCLPSHLASRVPEWGRRGRRFTVSIQFEDGRDVDPSPVDSPTPDPPRVLR